MNRPLTALTAATLLTVAAGCSAGVGDVSVVAVRASKTVPKPPVAIDAAELDEFQTTAVEINEAVDSVMRQLLPKGLVERAGLTFYDGPITCEHPDAGPGFDACLGDDAIMMSTDFGYGYFSPDRRLLAAIRLIEVRADRFGRIYTGITGDVLNGYCLVGYVGKLLDDGGYHAVAQPEALIRLRPDYVAADYFRGVQAESLKGCTM